MSKKVMLVEDEDTMFEFVKMGLELEGYEVVGTTNALDAIELAHSQKPDIIILDYVMPGIDVQGPEFLKYYKGYSGSFYNRPAYGREP
jgi:CheY-like chemotaxis protein